MSAIQKLLTDHIDIWTAADTEKKSGRGRSSGNASSVYGIKKLRELILELAVRGKLVPHQEDWKACGLGQLGQWAVGSGFPTAEQGLSDCEVLFAKVSDMNLPENSKHILTTIHTVSRETAKRIRANIHPEGTVIFPKIGGAIATKKRRILSKPSAIDNNCLGITPRDGVSSEWLFTLLTSIDFTKYQAGTSVPALAQRVLENIEVLVPPLAEQHRIVAKVDELMALCDQLETQHINAADAHEQLVSHLLGTLTESQSAEDFSENWQRIAAHFDTLFTTEASIDALKQTLLQLAVCGKLVPQDPNDEPASELLKRIQVEKTALVAQGKLKKDKPLPAIAEEEKQFSLPGTWEWARLGTIGYTQTGSTPSKSMPEAFGSDVPFIKPGDIYPNTVDYENERLSFLGAKLSGRLAPSGSLLMVCIGTIGKCNLINTECSFNQQINSATPYIFDSGFLLAVCRSGYFQSEAWSRSSSTTIAILNKGNWEGICVPVPPLAEQHRIVAKVDELMAFCDQLSSRLADLEKLKRVIADVVVEQAVA